MQQHHRSIHSKCDAIQCCCLVKFLDDKTAFWLTSVYRACDVCLCVSVCVLEHLMAAISLVIDDELLYVFGVHEGWLLHNVIVLMALYTSFSSIDHIIRICDRKRWACPARCTAMRVRSFAFSQKRLLKMVAKCSIRMVRCTATSSTCHKNGTDGCSIDTCFTCAISSRTYEKYWKAINKYLD